MAYFDYNATTPLNSAARQALVDALDTFWANPSSPYRQSAQVHNALAAAREILAKRLGKSPEEVIFNGGVTEANNAVIRHLADHLQNTKLLVLSPFEHPSIAEPARQIFGERVQTLKASSDGTVDADHLDELLKQGVVGAVSVMAVNNETGVVQPWQAIGERCHNAGIPFHCDASQWFGKCAGGDFSYCDFLVGCGHKFGGPKGVGFLALSKNSLGFRSALGGGQESGRRGGTENVSSILSLVAALEYSDSQLDHMLSQAKGRDEFEAALQSRLPEISCIGKSAARVPNTSFLVLPQFENLRWVRKLDLKGFQVSTGSACATGETGSSAVLDALGYPADAGRKTVRVSAGPTTSANDWTELIEAFLQVWDDLSQPGTSSGSAVISI
ncbi:MAG: cysteine desulfurase family protein [Verrucomicrobia bacterium]|nr:cysteine desulfurase family protein [Verrucomicrobiota bacterium]